MFTNHAGEKKSSSLVEKLQVQKSALELKENELKRSLEEVEKRREEEKRRTWISEGLAKFSTLMRTSSSVKELTVQLISGLVRYVDVNQGAFFILDKSNPDDIHLKMAACYGYERNESRMRFEVGQDLVGQCMLDKEINYLTSVPKNYLKITSGLGNSAPSVLILLPIFQNNKDHGVIELAAFKEIPPFKINFLETLCEAIAAALDNIEGNDEIKKLLAESQKLTTEMRQQEEEMKQNLEELNAVQEQMSRKEIDYQKKIHELTN
jgi:hypothetical protein